jgi:hypothetical protein
MVNNMAIKKVTGGSAVARKKPATTKMTKMVAQPKPKKAKSKNVAQGNENARELYNLYRGGKNVPGAARAKVTKAEAAKGGTQYGVPMATVRKTQRAGGKGR